MARQLWLLRHAEAEPHGTRADAERRLTKRGRQQARAAGVALRAHAAPTFDGVLFSPRVRARQTAELAAEGWSEAQRARLELLSAARPAGFDAAQALDAMRGAAGGRRACCWSGTSPTSRGGRPQLTGARVDLKKGGLAVVRLEGAGGELVVVMRPRELALIAGASAPGRAREPAARASQSAGSDDGHGARVDDLDRFGREAVADAEVGVDVAPSRARPSRASGAACARTRPPSGRRGPSCSPTGASRSPRARAPAPRRRRAARSARTRASSGRCCARRRTPGSGRSGSPPRRRGSAAVSARLALRRRRRTTLCTRAITSSGWHGLVIQSSAPRRSPRTRWATVEGPVHTTMPELRQRLAQPLEPAPRLRSEHGEVDDQRAQAHRDDGVGRHRAGEHPVLPGEAVQALAEHLDEAAVAIEHGDAKGCRWAAGGVRCRWRAPRASGAHARAHRGAV